MAKPSKIYWYSCAWLGLLNGEADKRRELEIVYGYGRKEKVELWTSALAVIECRRLSDEKHSPKPLRPDNDEKISDIFRQPFVKVAAMDREIAERARTLWRTTPKLGKFQDAVHLVSAVRWNIEVFHTYDNEDLLHLDGKLRCRNGQVLRVVYPDNTTDGDLFAVKNR